MHSPLKCPYGPCDAIFRMSPLGNGDHRLEGIPPPRADRFVLALTVVCIRTFQSPGLRKHPGVGLLAYGQRSGLDTALPGQPELVAPPFKLRRSRRGG